MEDNQATIKTAQNEIRNERSKHIDVRYHFIRECVANNKLKVAYCATEEMTADMLTKPLAKSKMRHHTSDGGSEFTSYEFKNYLTKQAHKCMELRKYELSLPLALNH